MHLSSHLAKTCLAPGLAGRPFPKVIVMGTEPLSPPGRSQGLYLRHNQPSLTFFKAALRLVPVQQEWKIGEELQGCPEASRHPQALSAGWAIGAKASQSLFGHGRSTRDTARGDLARPSHLPSPQTCSCPALPSSHPHCGGLGFACPHRSPALIPWKAIRGTDGSRRCPVPRPGPPAAESRTCGTLSRVPACSPGTAAARGRVRSAGPWRAGADSAGPVPGTAMGRGGGSSAAGLGLSRLFLPRAWANPLSRFPALSNGAAGCARRRPRLVAVRRGRRRRAR